MRDEQQSSDERPFTAGLNPAIHHDFLFPGITKTWMSGTRPGMTPFHRYSE
jgi:hypothetical protein